MNCELCGNEEAGFQVEVEGTIMMLCEKCSSFGKVLSKAKLERPTPKSAKRTVQPQDEKEEVMLVVVPDFGVRIKQKREKLKLKQEDFAKKIAEKESLLHQIESGKFAPSIALARKFEKALGITLVEEHKEKPQHPGKTTDDSMTLGDFLK